VRNDGGKNTVRHAEKPVDLDLGADTEMVIFWRYFEIKAQEAIETPESNPPQS
jgi:hypothetical protein